MIHEEGIPKVLIPVQPLTQSNSIHSMQKKKDIQERKSHIAMHTRLDLNSDIQVKIQPQLERILVLALGLLSTTRDALDGTAHGPSDGIAAEPLFAARLDLVLGYLLHLLLVLALATASPPATARLRVVRVVGGGGLAAAGLTTALALLLHLRLGGFLLLRGAGLGGVHVLLLFFGH
jgi:hypothetical protein